MDSLLEELRRELQAAIEGRTPADLQTAPAGKWNASQILEHLYLTYSHTNKGIAKCLRTGHPLATPATMVHRVKAFVVVGLGYLPGGAKAPERAIPTGMPGDEVRTAIFTEMEQMASGLDECERKFGPATKIMDHPILGPLTAAQWRKFRSEERRVGKEG